MLAIIAAIIFAIAFLLDVTSTATSAVFAPARLLLLGLTCLALHIAGIGTGWSFTPRRRRRLLTSRGHASCRSAAELWNRSLQLTRHAGLA
jgi:hypothetical protein